jgi:hypothetical protein
MFSTREHDVRKGVWSRTLAVCLLLVMVAEVAFSTRQQSPSWDEGDHIYSGYMNWLHDEYDMNPEHPPLVKLVATLPLLGLQLHTAPRQGRYFKDEAYYGGRALLFGNAPRYSADTLLFRMHMAVLFFGLLLAWLVFLAGQELFGTLAGLLAMLLYVFDPTVLANAPFVATDTGASCALFATVYVFYRFLTRPTLFRALLCGVVAGLALATKHSLVLLLPILLLLFAGDLFRADTRQRLGAVLRGMVAITAVALTTLWAVYSFRFSMGSNGVTRPSFAKRVAPPTGAGLRALLLFMHAHHLLPESYLYGLADVQLVGLLTPSYIFGQIHAHGVWYYFPVLLSLKWTAGTLGLLVLAVYAFATQQSKHARALWFLGVPALFYLLVAVAGPLNIGVRHVLPVFPFLFVLLGGGAALLLRQQRRWALPAIALLLTAHVVASVRAFPNYLPFANVFWGGAANTHLYFTDSAVDWGQQLKETKRWLDAHHVEHCSFAYFVAPFLMPSDYGIPCQVLPTADTQAQMKIDVPAVIHGPLLVSYGTLSGYEYGTKLLNPYESLKSRKPDAVIADGIAVFFGDFHLPEAAALQYVQASADALKTNPAAAVAAAQQAVALVPNGIAAQRALGDAELAAGNQPAACAAYGRVLQRLPEMEPSARAEWQHAITSKLPCPVTPAPHL